MGRNFRNYMIRNGGIEKCFNRKSEVRVFYIDEEDDEIFVDTDDEYRELLKIASAKNKVGETMALTFQKSRRGLDSRRRSYGERRQLDLFGREVRSPGKVMKHQLKHFDNSGSGKVWKMTSNTTSSTSKASSRGKVPGKLTSLNGSVSGPPDSMKPLTIADGLNEVKELSRSLEETRTSSGRRLAKSPETCELLRQQASVFEWMNKNAVVEAEKDSPPDWFLNYMENYREEMAAEITTKVVHSLGIVIDNKLAVLLDRKAEAKVDESDFAKKVRKDKVKVKKVKTEAMRMTMELGEESLESKELKKSLIKKTDKVVKVAMKIEKKNHQEQKGRKASLSSCCNSEQLQALKLSEKKEKKAPKVKEEKKAKEEKKTKKSKPKKD